MKNTAELVFQLEQEARRAQQVLRDPAKTQLISPADAEPWQQLLQGFRVDPFRDGPVPWLGISTVADQLVVLMREYLQGLRQATVGLPEAQEQLAQMRLLRQRLHDRGE